MGATLTGEAGGGKPLPYVDFERRATLPLTSVPTTLVNMVGVAVTTVGAGFTPARSGVRESTRSAYLSEGDTRDA